MRHAFLDLDETIAYDQDEDDTEDDPVVDVGQLFDPDNRDMDGTDNVNCGTPVSVADIDSVSSHHLPDSSDSSSDSDEEEPVQMWTSRTGWRINPPAYLRDFRK